MHIMLSLTNVWPTSNKKFWILAAMGKSSITLQWRHNGRDSISNHQPHDCLLNRVFRRRLKKTSKLRVTGLCAGNSPGPVNSPHKWPVTRKMVPFDDVIMISCPAMETTQPMQRCSFTKGLRFNTLNKKDTILRKIFSQTFSWQIFFVIVIDWGFTELTIHQHKVVNARHRTGGKPLQEPTMI